MSNTITIVNCTLPSSYSISTKSGSVITNDAIPISSFINSLKLTEKEGYYCYIKYFTTKKLQKPYKTTHILLILSFIKQN